MAFNSLKEWQVDRGSIRYIGEGLQRPECILAEPNGTLWSADGRGGIMRIDPDGSQRLVLQSTTARNESSSFEDRYVNTIGSLPNGLAFDKEGNFLIANFGNDSLELMTRDGRTRTLVDNIDGEPVGKANFVTRDTHGRLWLTVTTRMVPWTRHVETMSHDGYIAVIDERGARIVADGLCGTNELRFDLAEDYLYVAETTKRRISRFRVLPDGELGPRATHGPENVGGFCDGIAFDTCGNLWSTLIMADRLIAVTPEGEVLVILDDGNPKATAALDAAWHDGQVTPELMAAATGTIAPWMASLTFGGPDLRTVYLGSLRGHRIPYFRSPIPGLPLIYWGERQRGAA
ncbi:SMP-30/gluconolactonase/LRE family protein [Agrobacterium rhizogenes]|uniref:Gluconolactonase n=1 Tax=Rhizobium rhizogenes (strain K84 / ATCC BAA-868) TaxID=311403 RepID=B9JQB6_RHIR8|nr:SMP-30/gluconolactonase/LRE family protein [Rhizobium rhizogenes]ACM31335.1 Gluconolactonase [Rhizobium rhizogenes K84]OCJ22068.1 gluconolactonase [Agrobacterium sp. B131/95]OCJ24415.1 gluconolactonase [Agrobacterium sp. B133/95]NTI46284.1 SMP-30/gluconolactonase/LRE family protein [Rhizobium rhizogenes]NTI52967.1 SMP-30/gluconolactonase/LRE family protein [Rhizobium rhizogenes]